MSVEEIQDFVYIFFPFMFGIYPYTAVTDRQRKAMRQANVDYVCQSIYEITYACLVRLLDNKTMLSGGDLNDSENIPYC